MIGCSQRLFSDSVVPSGPQPLSLGFHTVGPIGVLKVPSSGSLLSDRALGKSGPLGLFFYSFGKFL